MEILKTLHDCGHEFKECLNMKKTNCRRITTNMMTKSHLFTWTIVTLYKFFSFSNEEAGADPRGGGRTRRAPPLKLEKNMIFWRKIVIFHTKYPKNVRASLRSAQVF
jgi:hypothetical protein